MVKVECCDLCYEGKGEIREAVAWYMPDGATDPVYICEECKKLVDQAKFTVWPI